PPQYPLVPYTTLFRSNKTNRAIKCVLLQVLTNLINGEVLNLIVIIGYVKFLFINAIYILCVDIHCDRSTFICINRHNRYIFILWVTNTFREKMLITLIRYIRTTFKRRHMKVIKQVFF